MTARPTNTFSNAVCPRGWSVFLDVSVRARSGKIDHMSVRNILQSLRRWRVHKRTHRALFAARRAELAASLRTPQQFIGTNSVGCGATHGIMEKCNFSCTSCYLSDVANYARPLPFEQIREQLDALRAHLGARGKVQIISGEVTLLPVGELGRIIAYARHIGLDPMLMTNGQRLAQVPGYLRELVAEHGLRKISFHIDTTQKGRPGWSADLREADIHPVRSRFVRLVEDVRKETGKPLYAAQTVTVTAQNFDDIPDIIDWALAHAKTFRILSLLPVAEVGRTTDCNEDRSTMERLWPGVSYRVSILC